MGGWVGRGAREGVRMWLFPALHPQPLFTGIPRGGAPSRCRGIYKAAPNPPGGDAHPPLPVSAHLPSRWLAGSPCFSQGVSPQLSGPASLSLGLSFLSRSLLFSELCLSLLLSRPVCLCAPFSGSPVVLLQPQPLLWRAPETPTSSFPPCAGCLGWREGIKHLQASGRRGQRPGSNGQPWAQSEPRGPPRAPAPARRARPSAVLRRPPSLCAAFNGRLSARLPRKLYSRTSVIGGVPIVPGD